MTNEIFIFAIGLTTTEKKLLKGICAISQRRQIKLNMVDSADISKADVILIDEKSEETSQCYNMIKSLIQVKKVIWIDSGKTEQINLKRPVQWSQLPNHITRAFNTKNPSLNQLSSDIQTPVDTAHTERKAHILVVDDSVIVREQLKEILNNQDFDVTTADSGEAALSLFKPNYFDKILLDVIMPEADGYSICRKIRTMEGGKSVPIIMLTSKSSPFDKIRGKMAGCNAYLTKPVVFDKLLKELRS